MDIKPNIGIGDLTYDMEHAHFDINNIKTHEDLKKWFSIDKIKQLNKYADTTIEIIKESTK